MLVNLRMDHTDISRCIQILDEKPKRFFQKDNIADKLQCFHIIQQAGTHRTIYFVFSYLRSNNTLLQAKAAETVLLLFAKLKSLNPYSPSLKDVPIEKSDLDFFRLDFDEKTYVQLLGIASLNGNGYVREKAVKELARLKNTEGLKFILLRLGDWVEEVRKAATEAVAVYLDEVYIDALLQQLPVIDWLLKVERVDLSEIHSRIIQFIINQDFANGFYNKVKRLNDKTRFRLYKSFLASKNPGKEQVYKIVADSNFLVRNELLKQLLRFDPALQKELIKKLLHDPSAVVRLNALYASKSFSPELDQQIALLTSDQVASVRGLSRHLLNDKGIDFAKLYRQRIADKQFLPGSLLGLAETGNQDDLATFDQYIFSDSPNLVVPSLVAINTFSPDTAKHYALKLLAHKSKKIRSKAAEVLATGSNADSLNTIRGIYARGDYGIKKTILSLLSRIGGWNVIGDLLLGLTDENVNIQNLSWQMVDRWRVESIRLFTTPPAAAVERANQIYNNIDQSKLQLTLGRASLLEALKFYIN